MKKKEFGVLFGISVSLKITMAVILGLVSLIVIVLYCLVDSARAELTFAVGLLGGAAMIYAAYYAGISLRVAKYEGKQQRSFEILSSLNSIVMGKVRHLIEDEVFTKKIAPAELYQKILSDLDLLSGITALLGQFEDISIGVQYGYMDEDVLFYSLGFLVPWNFEGLKHYIDEERLRTGEEKLYCETEKLANAWNSRQSLRTGKTYQWPL